MPVRQPAVAGQFYPAGRAECVRMIESALPDQLPDDLPEEILGGVVPHAGWAYSGPTAARTYAAVRARTTPDTFVLFSAVHRWGAARPAVYARGAWATPLGEVSVDTALARDVLQEGEGILVDAPEAHAGEHSAEVQAPFIQHLFPRAHILPILVPANEHAVPAGEIVARVIARTEKRVVSIGTSDLTHYGAMYYGFAPAGTGEKALAWVRQNDRRIIDLIVALEAEKIVPETSAHHNACGGGALAATVAVARSLGAEEGLLLAYTTSHDVAPRGPASDFVGYAALVLGTQGQ